MVSLRQRVLNRLQRQILRERRCPENGIIYPPPCIDVPLGGGCVLGEEEGVDTQIQTLTIDHAKSQSLKFPEEGGANYGFKADYDYVCRLVNRFLNYVGGALF